MQTYIDQDMRKQASMLQDAAILETVFNTSNKRPRLVIMSMNEYDKIRGGGRIIGSALELLDSVAGQIEALAELDHAAGEL